MTNVRIDAGFDRFFLQHLQQVKGADASYYNQHFLGRGGNGTAFLVTCSSGHFAGTQMVLKVFHKISHKQRREAFLDEIKHLKKLNHPAIIRVYDEGEFMVQQREYPFAVLEYLPLTARTLLDNNKVDQIHAVRITLNCLSAFRCIHNQTPAILHRDIKPENILISPAGAKLADFGLAKSLFATPDSATSANVNAESKSDEEETFESEEDEAHLTGWPGMPFRYRSPELVARAKDKKIQLSTASDIYQLGTVFYEMITGFNPQRPPKKITDPIQLDVREVKGAQGVALFELAKAMLQEDPTKRPNASECLERLDRIHRALCESLTAVTGQPV